MKEQVLYGAVSNYHVTLFFRRSSNPCDKTMYISDPIWHDDSQPSATASYLYMMQEASKHLAGEV